MRVRCAFALLALLTGSACDDEGEPGRGLALWVRAAPGQLVPGPLPAPSGGPAVSALEVPRTRVSPGEAGFVVGGRLARGGAALRLMLEDDAGHWIVPGGFVDVVHPDEIEWHARLELSPSLPFGPRALVVQATDAAGVPGPPATVALDVAPDLPKGALVVTLAFDADADVDLRVRTPGGGEVDATHVARDGSGAFVDHDANAGCRIDGRRRESAVWPAAPAPGRYAVFVGLASPCGAARVTFAVHVWLASALLARGAGVLYPEDARFSGRTSAPPGLAILSFDVP